MEIKHRFSGVKGKRKNRSPTALGHKIWKNGDCIRCERKNYFVVSHFWKEAKA
jgi:hypothetical protein